MQTLANVLDDASMMPVTDVCSGQRLQCLGTQLRQGIPSSGRRRNVNGNARFLQFGYGPLAHALTDNGLDGTALKKLCGSALPMFMMGIVVLDHLYSLRFAVNHNKKRCAAKVIMNRCIQTLIVRSGDTHFHR